MRRKFKVICVLEDGTRPEFTFWAESPEHAKRRAERELPPGSVVISTTAEDVTHE